MNARILLLPLLCLGLTANAAGQITNQLKHHPSPYLTMHAADPVAWQDWGQTAVERARREGKLLFISVGYFSCHWCHVMQRESYRNPDIAAFLNRHFVPVKVDRELEAALDARLIEFAERTRGQGGWPLNVFITPEGYPMYAALYLPPAEFKSVLERLQGLWTKDRAGLERLARDEAKHAATPAEAPVATGNFVEQVLAQADLIHGGFGDQSKFPSAPQLEALLVQVAARPEPRLKEFLKLTFDHMADLGLYDHVGGGFFRYTVDPSWKTPHFEKMLYDNALLARVYLHAAKALREPRYEQVARATLDFMARELRAPDGALIASLSAVDDKGVEGGYYLWSADELTALLSEQEANVLRLAFSMQDAAPFEAGYLPLRSIPPVEVAKRLGMDTAAVETALSQALETLHWARGKRALPRDTKLLAGWNGLALAAFAEAARATGEAKYRDLAAGIHGYLMHALWDGKTLKRAVHKGRAVGAVALEDHAYVTQGLLEWARLTDAAADYAQAISVARVAWQRFYAARGWRLDERSLIQTAGAEPALADGPLPSPSAVLIEATLALAEKTGDMTLARQARAARDLARTAVQRDRFWQASHGALLAEGL
ncbi:MAG: thioredoxin domain-containing protein [Gammaproteobacteria bacterium]|nr:thioredoxin domain-containing protein [Gammaproteobacteria bacterium]